jgi:hypothetical protein
MKEANVFYRDGTEIYCFPTPHKEVAEGIMRFKSYLGKADDEVKKELLDASERNLQYYLRKVKLTKRANQKILFDFKESVLNLYSLRNAFYNTPIPLLEH